jgi:hypothetical protein
MFYMSSSRVRVGVMSDATISPIMSTNLSSRSLDSFRLMQSFEWTSMQRFVAVYCLRWPQID